MSYNFYSIHTSQSSVNDLKNLLLVQPGEKAILDASKVICKNQILAAITRVERVKQQEKMISNDWGIELLLQLTGKHQISEALKLLEVTESTKNILYISRNEPPCEYSSMNFDFILTKEILMAYELQSNEPCLEIIERGVLLMANHY
ncbi:MAG: hypothetical protein INQ03_12085 [Candidatus Heimdallarchaeota archaeon]|nr:hypothetical protein [Candidatus Heimdallarchaeota archaeon]